MPFPRYLMLLATVVALAGVTVLGAALLAPSVPEGGLAAALLAGMLAWLLVHSRGR